MQRKLTLAILLVLGLSALMAAPAHADLSGRVSNRISSLWDNDSRLPPGLFMNPAPRPVGDVRFLDAQGRTVHLADFKGRLVIINLWATWCPTCRLELPELNSLQDTLGKEGLSVVAVSLDKEGVPLAANYYRENQINVLPVFLDPQWELKKNFGVEGVPASILISRDGWELGRANGFLNWTSPEMLVFLRNLLEAQQD